MYDLQIWYWSVLFLLDSCGEYPAEFKGSYCLLTILAQSLLGEKALPTPINHPCLLPSVAESSSGYDVYRAPRGGRVSGERTDNFTNWSHSGTNGRLIVVKQYWVTFRVLFLTLLYIFYFYFKLFVERGSRLILFNLHWEYRYGEMFNSNELAFVFQISCEEHKVEKASKINIAISIYPISRHQCNEKIKRWLMLLDYDATEDLLLDT